MAEPKQRYRMTFKCSCGNVFKKITSNMNLIDPPCPECKKKGDKTPLVRMGDGPIPESEKHAYTPEPRPAPNTIYQCEDCHSIAKIFEDIGETVLHSCPACDSSAIKYRGKISKDISSEAVMKNKCVDKTADIVMTDYKMTDLKDNVRVGESMAPKLGAGAQSVADQMMGKKSTDGMMSVYDANTRRIVKIPQNRNGAALAKRAMSGAMRGAIDPVQALHTSETRGR